MPRPLSLILSVLAFLCIIAGAGLVLAGALGPWAQVVVFKNIDLSLPGFLFVGGGLCLAVAVLVLLGARRSPALCLIGALLALGWVAAARRDVPRRVKHQVIGAQMALFPINRLLDQFHIGDIEVGDWSVPDGQLLGPGLTWTTWGGGLLLLGGLLGLPGDPLVGWVYARVARRQCRACGARWRKIRDAQFCPQCGVRAQNGRQRRCAACQTEASKTDHHCITCGATLPDYGRGAN